MSKTDTDKAIEEMLGSDATEAGSENNAATEEAKKENTEATASDNTEKETAKDSSETDWKAEARKWENRAKENKANADKYSEVEKQFNEFKAQHEKDIAEREQALTSASLDVTRWKIAAKYKVSEEDVELFLNGTDEETLEKQAQRLSQNSAHTPKPDNAQGRRTETGPLSTTQQGAAALEGLFN